MAVSPSPPRVKTLGICFWNYLCIILENSVLNICCVHKIFWVQNFTLLQNSQGCHQIHYTELNLEKHNKQYLTKVLPFPWTWRLKIEVVSFSSGNLLANIPSLQFNLLWYLKRNHKTLAVNIVVNLILLLHCILG